MTRTNWIPLTMCKQVLSATETFSGGSLILSFSCSETGEKKKFNSLLTSCMVWERHNVLRIFAMSTTKCYRLCIRDIMMKIAVMRFNSSADTCEKFFIMFFFYFASYCVQWSWNLMQIYANEKKNILLTRIFSSR